MLHPMFRFARKALTLLLVAAVVALGPLSQSARAEIVSTATMLAAEDAQAARARVGDLLARADVQEQLEAYGVSPAEAEARIASLSDAEISQLDARLEELPAGRDFLALVVSVLVVTLLVLLISDLLGFSDVFPFVNELPRGEAKSERRGQ